MYTISVNLPALQMEFMMPDIIRQHDGVVDIASRKEVVVWVVPWLVSIFMCSQAQLQSLDFIFETLYL